LRSGISVEVKGTARRDLSVMAMRVKRED
jgi:hypothetical protein